MTAPTPLTARRHVQLQAGLVLFGVSLAMIIQSDLGNSPWDVLHQGLGRTFGGGTGLWTIIVGAAVLAAWVPLRQRPGFGTLCNVVVIGVVMDVVLTASPTATTPVSQVALLAGGIVLNGVATGLYIGASFGPGPRDGLMTGLAQRGISIRAARTGIEVAVLVGGFLLGGTLGIGTLAYALAIGPLAHHFIPLCTPRALASPTAAGAAVPTL